MRASHRSFFVTRMRSDPRASHNSAFRSPLPSTTARREMSSIRSIRTAAASSAAGNGTALRSAAPPLAAIA